MSSSAAPLRRRIGAVILMLAMAAAAPLPSAAAHAGARLQLAQAGPSLRRGDTLPDAYRGQVVTDYEHWHLRRPPSGYAWYRVGDQFVLASMSTGIIFDVVSING